MPHAHSQTMAEARSAQKAIGKLVTRCRSLDATLQTKPVSMPVNRFIERNTRILTIGSCFAHELQIHLKRKGFNLLGSEITNQFLWYNTFSILYEFERITGEFGQTPEDCWEQSADKFSAETLGGNPPVGSRIFQDPYRAYLYGNSREELWHATTVINDFLRNAIATADVLVVTLGLTEVWFEPHHGRVVCGVPGKEHGNSRVRESATAEGVGVIGGEPRDHRGQARFRFSGYEENLANMQRVVEILQSVNPACRLIVTTSPVPLTRTFSGCDHVVANAESKSILRAVAGALARKYEHVDYFPSYEMVVYSDRNLVFQEDGQHVDRDYVTQIMQQFEQHFVAEEAESHETPRPHFPLGRVSQPTVREQH